MAARCLRFGVGAEDEAALKGVGGERNVLGGGTLVDVQHEIVREAGGEDERSAFDGQDDVGLEQAGHLVGVGRPERRSGGWLDRGKANDDDRLGIVKGRRRVEAEVEGRALGKGDRGNVLILCGVEIAGDADEVDDGADVRAVRSAAGERGGAGGVDEVGVGAAGERGDHSLAVAVVEQGLVAALREAGVLHIDGPLEAVVVGLEVEGAREQHGVLGQGLLIGGCDLADLGDVFFDACLFKAGLCEVLGRTDKDAGTSAHGGTQGAEAAAGLRCEKEDGLLGLFGDGDGHAFGANMLVPGLDAVEPVVRGRVGGSTEKDGDEQISGGLGWGQIGMEAKCVARLKVGNRGDGQGFAGAGDADIDLGAGEVEPGRRGLGSQKRRGKEEQGGREEPGALGHSPILAGSGLS